MLANDDDSGGYSAATGVSGDVVLEETQTVYDDVDNSGLVMMRVSIARDHTDAGGGLTTGGLDTGGDGNPLVVTSGDLKGRVAQVEITPPHRATCWPSAACLWWGARRCKVSRGRARRKRTNEVG